MDEKLEPAPLPDWVIPCVRLWERKSGRGRFMAGKWGAAKVLIYANPHRRDENDAEWLLCLAAGEPFETQDSKGD